MNKSQAIKAFCSECAGESHKDVSLCVIKDCQLYPYRFGNSPHTKAYKGRMKLAKERWPDEYASVMGSLEPGKQ